MGPHVCPWWQAYVFDHPGRKLVQNPRNVVGPHVTPGMTAMDIGCGMGFFSIAMARMVGAAGTVVAVDVQHQMLDVLMKRARRAGVADRIRTVNCRPDSLGVDEPVDFALACYMMHEAAGPARLLGQVRACLTPGARFLILEPGWHVPRKAFERTLELAEAAGLRVVDRRRTWMDRIALLEAS